MVHLGFLKVLLGVLFLRDIFKCSEYKEHFLSTDASGDFPVLSGQEMMEHFSVCLSTSRYHYNSLSAFRYFYMCTFLYFWMRVSSFGHFQVPLSTFGHH